MIKQRHLRLVKDVAEEQADLPAKWSDLGFVALWLLPAILMLVSSFLGMREGWALWQSDATRPSMFYSFCVYGILGTTLFARMIGQKPVAWFGYFASFDVVAVWLLLAMRSA